MRRAKLLIAGAEAPYFWLIGAVFKILPYPHGQERTKHYFNPPVLPIAQPHLFMKNIFVREYCYSPVLASCLACLP